MAPTCDLPVEGGGEEGTVRYMAAKKRGKARSRRAPRTAASASGPSRGKSGKKAAKKPATPKKTVVKKVKKKPAAPKKAVKKKATSKPARKKAAKKKAAKKKAAGKKAAKKKAVKKKAAKKPARKKKTVKKKGRKRKTRKKAPRPPLFAPTVTPPPTPATSQMERKALTLFDKGMKQFHRKAYAKAEQQFQRLVEAFPQERELLARVQVFLGMCEQNLSDQERRFKSPEDHYYRAVVLANRGDHPRAIDHLDEALKMLRRRKKPGLKEDHVLYVLASTYALSGRSEEALETLGAAVKLNPRNRILALNSPDFAALRGEGRLHEAFRHEDVE